VNFEDRVLVRLADPTTRAAVFDQPGLEATVRAAYDADTMGISGPYEPVFDELRLGMAVPPSGSLNGSWRVTGAAEQTDAQFQLAGIGSDPPVRVDALWSGSIVARFALVGEPITAVSGSWAPVGANGTIERNQMEVGFAAPVSAGETLEPLALLAAVLIRDSSAFSLAQLLDDSKSIRERMLANGLALSTSNGTRPRQRLVVVWVLDGAIFADADWPGATAGQTPDQAQAARRAAASNWLADEGIGLVATAP
jgi:hypothetical protein